MVSADSFRDVFGERRGSNRPSEEGGGTLFTRHAIFKTLRSHVPYDTVSLALTGLLHYVALARSEFDDSLHIVGGGADISAALLAFEGAEDFAPAAVVDLNGASAETCVSLVSRTEGQVSFVGAWDLGITDLKP